MPRYLLPCVWLVFFLASSVRGGEPSAEDLEFFEKKIRPILAEHCYSCHSSAKKQRAGLMLDSKAALYKGGDTGPVLVPGQPERSLLLRAVGYKDPDLRMPPRSKLADAQIADLTEWVKRGAPVPAGQGGGATIGGIDLEQGRKHWAFQPLRKADVPAVQNSKWVRTPIDAFLLAALEARKITPAKETDKRTWLRRVTFDLIGLPPTPAEIDAFLKDNSPEAYAKVVDRLLASPHYGERWARHWLDLVRYADTCGHEFDFDMPYAYRYRDYIIRAFNGDVPYNQLVLEHLAGDLLPEPRRHPTEKFNESIIGTGFFFLGESKHSPVDIRAEGAERVDNQIDVMSKAFLGLTISCARCHDHKFDPIAQKDYYALAGYLRSSRFQHAAIDPPEHFQPLVKELQTARKEAALAATNLSGEVLRPGLAQLGNYLLAHRALTLPGADLAKVAQEYQLDRARLQRWQQQLGALVATPDHVLHPWRVLGRDRLPPEQFLKRKEELVKQLKTHPEFKGTKVWKDFRKTGYADWFVNGAAFTPTATLDPQLRPEGAVPVTALVEPTIPHSGRLGQRLEGTLRSPTFTIESKTINYLVAGSGTRMNLIIDGFQQIRAPIYGDLTLGINTGNVARWIGHDVSMWIGHRAYIEFLDEGPGWFALEKVVFSEGPRPAPRPKELVLALLADPQVDSAEKLAARYQKLVQELVEQWRTGALETASDRSERVVILNELLQSNLLEILAVPGEGQKELREQLTKALKTLAAIDARVPHPTYVMALADGTGENEYIFIRGNHKNPGPEAPRRCPEVLAGAGQPAPREGSGRLDLARRLVAPSNPLLPRVLVNRLWYHHFGTGLVASVDDFGHQGERPSHPELLDWLATEFIRSGWSIKHMHRLVVLSSTYRMASQAEARFDELDPNNRLLHRMPVQRLEAEAIRDAMLVVSGRLEQKLYGPGIMPYLTPFMNGRGRPGASGPLDGAGRRSIYINVRRNFLSPLFLAFDYPTPFTTRGRRSVSNVPAQALSLMNNPFVKQQAELWARRVLAEKDRTVPERIDRLYLSAFGRLPSADERADVLAFLDQQSKGKGDEIRVWSDLCHVLFNVKEFIFIN